LAVVYLDDFGAIETARHFIGALKG